MLKDIIRKLRVRFIRIKKSNRTIIYSNSLIIAPHPDDETIGCSGLIQQLISKGQRVDVIYMTGGGKSHSGCCNIG